jgi:uncharacterized membrane protein YgaE (UPF0421/DUF939 family)
LTRIAADGSATVSVVRTILWGAADIRDVQLAWRDQAQEARVRLREAIWPAVQAAAAAGLAWLVAHNLLGHAQPFFAPIAAAIALSTSGVRRGRRILQMVAGVSLGIAVGEAAAAVIGTNALTVGVVVLATMAAALLAGVGFFSEGMMFVNQSSASAILVVALHKHGTGAERLLDAVVGGAVAGMVGVVLFPADPLSLMRKAEREVLRSLAGALGRVAELMRAGSAGEAEWTLAAAADVHRQLAALGAARSTARANVRIAPRRWRLRAQVAREDARIARLDLLANAALSLFRVSADSLEEGDAVPVALCASIAELAEILAMLSRTAQPWPPALRSEVVARVNETIEAVSTQAGSRAPVIASIIRSTGRDVLGVLPPAAA